MKSAKSPDWRKQMMSRIRTLIRQADPKAVEEQKYKKPSNPAGIPVWYHDGMICTGETYNNHLRLTFAKGPSIKDPKGLFDTYRAITIREGEKMNVSAFKAIVRAAVALNVKAKIAPKPRRTSRKRVA